MKYAAQGLPPGLKINTGTGAITGTVAVGTAADGPYFVTVVANDGTYIGSADFTWNVNSPITITTPADQTNNEGASVSLSISATGGGTLRYAALGLPPGLVMSATTGAISGTITVGDAVNGPYSVTIGVGDGTYSATTSFTWNVNSPISITAPAEQTNNAGQTVSLSVLASGSGTLSYSATGLPAGLSINSSTGVISGTLSDGGSWSPTVTVGNGTYTNTASFNWTVSSPIVITDQGDQSNKIGDSISVQISAVDSASGTLSYSASGLPTSLSINSSTGLISGTVGGGASTTTPYTPTITVTDGTRTAVDTFEWDISQAGPVIVTNPGSQTNAVGDMVAVQTTAIDTNNAALLYSVTGLPTGLYLNPKTGLIFGTIASGATSGSPYSVTITAKDSASNTASQSFSWTINAAGTVTMVNPGDQTNAEGASVSLPVSVSGGGTLRYVTFGLPAGLSISTSTGAVSGTVALGDAANGPYTVTIEANDGTYSAAQTFLWTINSPVTITMPADQTNAEADTVSLSISASDSSGGTLVYAALGLPPGLKINTSTGAITGTVAKGAAVGGPYSVTIEANDSTYSAAQTFNWTINSPVSFTTQGDQADSDGDSVSLTISASGGGTLKYSAVGLPPGLTINTSTGAITGTIATGDSAIGSFSPTIIAYDGTYSSTTSFEWDISGTIAIADPGSQANVVGDTVSLQIGTTYTGGGTLTYAASGLPAGLGISTSTGLISGTITSPAASIGSFTTTVTVGDGTSSATDTFTWSVTSSGTVTMTTPSNQSNTEDSIVSLSISASGGGTLKYFVEGLPPGVKINPSTGVISGTIVANDAAYGPYSVTVIATDGTHFAAETFTWTVSGLVSIAAVADQTNNEGDTVSLTISASDLGGGTPKYSAVGLPAGLKISTSTGAITGTVALGDAACGPYTVTVTANDGTYSAAAIFTWTINGPVSIVLPPDQTNTEGDTVSLSLSASDSSGGTLKFSAVGLPAGLKINTSTGSITGIVATGGAANGLYNVTVTASDGTYSDSTTFNWTIATPIQFTNAASDEYCVGGKPVDVQFGATGSGGTLTYVAAGLPSGLSMNSGTGEVTGTVSNSTDAAGVQDETVTVTDGIHSSVEPIEWHILPVNVGIPTSFLSSPSGPSDENTYFAPAGDVKSKLKFEFTWSKDDGDKPKDATVADNVMKGFKLAGEMWSAIFSDDITVKIDIAYRGDKKTKLIGFTDSAQAALPYAATDQGDGIYNKLQKDKKSEADKTAFANLSTKAYFKLWINGTDQEATEKDHLTPYLLSKAANINSNLLVPFAELRALGYDDKALGNPASYAKITIKSDDTFPDPIKYNFTHKDIGANEIDFVGIAMHELAHAMGFDSGVDLLDDQDNLAKSGEKGSDGKPYPWTSEGEMFVRPLDLFRYSADSLKQGKGVNDFTLGGATRDRYFSIYGGDVNKAHISFAVGSATFGGDGDQASHWKKQPAGMAQLGLMAPQAGTNGTTYKITEADILALDVIGWDRIIADPGGI